MHTPPTPRRCFEDLAVGEVIPLGRTTLTRQMILDYAAEFDPLPFHLDEAAARASLLGGLAASGWQTAALSQRMLDEAFLNSVSTRGMLVLADLKWKRPVMAGDTISGQARIIDLRPSAQSPGAGIVTIGVDIRNQKGQAVLAMQLNWLVAFSKLAA
jgi:acyl dehydratase